MIGVFDHRNGLALYDIRSRVIIVQEIYFPTAVMRGFEQN